MAETVANQAIAVFIDMKDKMLADRAKDRTAAVDELLRLIDKFDPAKPGNVDAVGLAVKTVAGDLGTAGTVRIRTTSLVDLKTTASNQISIQVAANSGLPVSFGFGTTSGSTERSTSEVELEAIFAFPTTDFAAGLVDATKGNNAIAILNQLKDLIGQPQA